MCVWVGRWVGVCVLPLNWDYMSSYYFLFLLLMEKLNNET